MLGFVVTLCSGVYCESVFSSDDVSRLLRSLTFFHFCFSSPHFFLVFLFSLPFGEENNINLKYNCWLQSTRECVCVNDEVSNIIFTEFLLQPKQCCTAGVIFVLAMKTTKCEEVFDRYSEFIFANNLQTNSKFLVK